MWTVTLVIALLVLVLLAVGATLPEVYRDRQGHDETEGDGFRGNTGGRGDEQGRPQ